MRREIHNNFEIKLNFNKDTDNPSRLFYSFGAMIEGVRNLDLLLGETVDSDVESSIILNDIEKGSLIAKLKAKLIISKDGKIDDTPENPIIETYIDKSRAKALEFLASKESSVDELINLQTSIVDIAKDVHLEGTFNYSPPNLLRLAKSINTINEAAKKLDDGESYNFNSSLSDVKDLTSDTPLIDLKEVENALTDSTTVNESEMIYLIKKPDFLGDSAWTFKHGPKSINAKILHEDWLNRFKSGQLIVVPGDSLKVKVKQICKYNRNGYLISETLDIIKVLNVIHNKIDENK